jgi:hypothetical protein
MHATHSQGGACPGPTSAEHGSLNDQLIGLFTDPVRFRRCIQQQIEAIAASRQPAEPSALPAQDEADSYVVTDAGLRVLIDTVGQSEAPGTAGPVLRNAALYLERHGWIQGAYYDQTATCFTPAACMVGAIGMVCYGGPVEAPAQMFDDPGYLDFEEAVLHLDRYLMVEDGSESYEFNDVRGRTVDDITYVLRRAAAVPADELIDALRAIDAKDAQTAALVDLLKPCGTWGEPSSTPDGGDVE